MGARRPAAHAPLPAMLQPLDEEFLPIPVDATQIGLLPYK